MKILFLALSLVSVSAFAAQSEYLHQPYLSVRSMGAGGAFTAIEDTHEAMFFNPAMLMRRENGTINAGIKIGGTPSILSLMSDLSRAGSSAVNMQNTLLSHIGDHYSSRVSLGMVWARPSWGIAFIPLDLTLEADIRGSGGTTVGVQAYQDTTIQFSKAWNLNEEKTFNIGASPKMVYRAYFEKDITVLDLIDSTSLVQLADAQEGLTFDTDVGVMYMVTPPEEGFLKWMKYAKPTFSLTIRNLLDMGFKTNLKLFSRQSSLTTATLERRIDLGSRWDLPEFWVFKPRIMIDGRDMLARYASFKKSFHVGAELVWKAFGWLHGSYALGYSQGYLTFGVNAQASAFRLELASYSEEVGTTDARRESRRYMANLSLDF